MGDGCGVLGGQEDHPEGTRCRQRVLREDQGPMRRRPRDLRGAQGPQGGGDRRLEAGVVHLGGRDRLRAAEETRQLPRRLVCAVRWAPAFRWYVPLRESGRSGCTASLTDCAWRVVCLISTFTAHSLDEWVLSAIPGRAPQLRHVVVLHT